jgi:N-acetylneuraminate synthase/N,N'-diacetyllegionaminate synthase
MVSTIAIGERVIGAGQPCFIIAEAGVNHNGDLALARRLIDVANEARADAVKFQTFKAERVASHDAPKAEYQQHFTERGESQFEMLRRLELSPEMHRELMARCRRAPCTHGRQAMFLSTPFDEQSADLLESLGVRAFKLSSGEVTNLPFLSHVARKRKPIILSTGMATLDEVAEAVRTIELAGNAELLLLHCTTNYPADPRCVNLRAMRTLAAAFGYPVGFSDHTPGIEVALAAVALGACVIEKHFTLDRNLPGPDHQASLEPNELRMLVQGIRNVESALGDGVKRPAESELENLPVARRSLHWRRSLEAGAVIGAEDLIALRPGTGIPPGKLPALLGRALATAVAEGKMVRAEDLCQ